MTDSILKQARKDGYAAGRKAERDYQAQLSQCRWDEAHAEGRREGWEAGVRAGTIGLRLRWMAFGATFISFFWWLGS